jgi:hypothetical protein
MQRHEYNRHNYLCINDSLKLLFPFENYGVTVLDPIITMIVITLICLIHYKSNRCLRASLSSYMNFSNTLCSLALEFYNHLNALSLTTHTHTQIYIYIYVCV